MKSLKHWLHHTSYVDIDSIGDKIIDQLVEREYPPPARSAAQTLLNRLTGLGIWGRNRHQNIIMLLEKEKPALLTFPLCQHPRKKSAEPAAGLAASSAGTLEAARQTASIEETPKRYLRYWHVSLHPFTASCRKATAISSARAVGRRRSLTLLLK